MLRDLVEKAWPLAALILILLAYDATAPIEIQPVPLTDRGPLVTNNEE